MTRQYAGHSVRRTYAIHADRVELVSIAYPHHPGLSTRALAQGPQNATTCTCTGIAAILVRRMSIYHEYTDVLLSLCTGLMRQRINKRMRFPKA